MKLLFWFKKEVSVQLKCEGLVTKWLGSHKSLQQSDQLQHHDIDWSIWPEKSSRKCLRLQGKLVLCLKVW